MCRVVWPGVGGGQPPDFTEDIYATQGRETSQEPGRDHHLQSIQKGVTGKSWPVGVEEKREQEIPFIYCRGAPGAALAGGFPSTTEDIGDRHQDQGRPTTRDRYLYVQELQRALTKGDPECPVCEAGPLDWSGVN